VTVNRGNIAQFLSEFVLKSYEAVNSSIEPASNCKTNWYFIVPAP